MMMIIIIMIIIIIFFNSGLNISNVSVIKKEKNIQHLSSVIELELKPSTKFRSHLKSLTFYKECIHSQLFNVSPKTLVPIY